MLPRAGKTRSWLHGLLVDSRFRGNDDIGAGMTAIPVRE